jgi:GH24 family phage-related lysozyme (muramidase)
MDLSDRGMRLLIEFEGCHKKLPDGRYKSYRCPANVATIYAGLTRGVKDGMIITEEQGKKMLAKELATFEDAVERLVTVPMNQNRFDALVLLAYNIGVGAFQKSTLLKLLNQGKYAAAAAQFERWNKGGGRVLPGLVTRRKREAALFMEPMKDDAPVCVPSEEEGVMPQAVEAQKVPLKEVGKSPTIISTVAGLASSVGVGWQWLGTVASDTTAEVTATKQSLSGFEALWSHAGVSLGGVLLVVTIASLGIVLVRHVKRYQEGRA